MQKDDFEAKVAFNFSALKKGGGQNVGLNFLMHIIDKRICQNSVFIVVKDSEIHQFLKAQNLTLILAKKNPLLRILDEYFRVSTLLKRRNISLVYTYFGYSFLQSGIKQVSGVAVSNLFFPEVEFWQGGVLKRSLKKIIDVYRLAGLRVSDGLIFENKAMFLRCEKILKRSKVKKALVLPSITRNQFTENPGWDIENLLCPKLLVFSSWQLNKNLMRMPDVAHVFKSLGFDCKFVITAPEDGSYMHRRFKSRLAELQVENYFVFTGVVEKRYIPYLYSHIDIVLLLSKLESFSNNIIEAWTFERPLLVSDALWSRGICNGAAMYVDRDNSADIAECIIHMMENEEVRRSLVTHGIVELRKYPNIEEKTRQELAFVRSILMGEI